MHFNQKLHNQIENIFKPQGRNTNLWNDWSIINRYLIFYTDQQAGIVSASILRAYQNLGSVAFSGSFSCRPPHWQTWRKETRRRRMSSLKTANVCFMTYTHRQQKAMLISPVHQNSSSLQDVLRLQSSLLASLLTDPAAYHARRGSRD